MTQGTEIIQFLWDQLSKYSTFKEIGCVRQNLWANGLYWGVLRGRAILKHIATPHVVQRPGISSGTVWIANPLLDNQVVYVTFRAGSKWKDYWWEDLMQEAGLHQGHGAFIPSMGIILWEHEGALTPVERVFSAEELFAAREEIYRRIRLLNEKPEAPPRIQKNGPRMGLCYYCPAKKRCDAADMTEGATWDWP